MAGELDVLKAYASMINTGNIGHLEPYLDENFHYASQGVLDELTDKASFLEYITPKIAAIRASGNNAWAEIGHLDANGETPCVIVAQGEINNLVAIVFAKISSGKAVRLDLCCVPPPELAERSGIYPGLG